MVPPRKLWRTRAVAQFIFLNCLPPFFTTNRFQILKYKTTRSTPKFLWRDPLEAQYLRFSNSVSLKFDSKTVQKLLFLICTVIWKNLYFSRFSILSWRDHRQFFCNFRGSYLPFYFAVFAEILQKFYLDPVLLKEHIFRNLP